MKGKHGQAAAVRQEVQTRDAEIATYQQRVVKLTAENRSLRDELRGEQQRYREVERRLRAERDNGAAPQIEALQLLLKARSEEMATVRKEAHKNKDLQQRTAKMLLMHFIKIHGLTYEQCIQGMGAVLMDLNVAGALEYENEGDELAQRFDAAIQSRHKQAALR